MQTDYVSAGGLGLTQNLFAFYFACRRGAKYCSQCVCMSVCSHI